MSVHTHQRTTKLTLSDDAGHSHDLSLETSSDLPAGWAQLLITDPTTGAVQAIPIRLKMTDSGGRIAADFPGCDPNVCITDAGGHITNG